MVLAKRFNIFNTITNSRNVFCVVIGGACSCGFRCAALGLFLVYAGGNEVVRRSRAAIDVAVIQMELSEIQKGFHRNKSVGGWVVEMLTK